MDLSIYLWYYSAAGIYFSFRWGPFVHSLVIVQWDSTRRDHPGYPGRVSGSGLVNPVDPTRSTGQRDSLLKWKENVKRKCGLIFEFWKIRPKGGTVLLWSRHLLLSLFLNGENQVRTKNPNDSSMEKKRSAKTKFLGPGIRLPIRKVLHMR